MNKWSQDDRQHVKIPGSWERVCFNEVMSFMQNECVRRKLPAPVQMLPPEWRAKVGDEEYSEMWLKIYSLARTLWRFGNSGREVISQTFCSIAAARVRIPVHFRKIGGEWRLAVWRLCLRCGASIHRGHSWMHSI